MLISTSALLWITCSTFAHGATLPKRWNSSSSYLDQAGLTVNNKAIFDIGMDVLDSNFGLPLLCATLHRLAAAD
jgi:hypothetical protein